jgi:hypothetical protein
MTSGSNGRLANPKSVDNLTEEQYNNFGWVRANDVLNSGEYMIAVSDIGDTLNYGIDNIIVYAKGGAKARRCRKC